MTAGATRAQAWPAVRGTVDLRELAPIDPLLLRDVAHVLVGLVLVVLALAAMAASGAFLAGPVPAAGPAPGFAL